MADLTAEQSVRFALDHHRNGRLTEAEAIYRQVLTAQPNHADALQLLGTLALQVGRVQDAAQLIAQAIRHNPGQANYYNNYGEALRQMNRLDDAHRAYEQALSLDPKFAAAASNLSALDLSRGRPDSALVWARRAVTIAPKFASAWSCFIRAACAAGKIDDAIAACHQAHHQGAISAQFLTQVSSTLDQMRQYQAALDVARLAIQLDPNNGDALLMVGVALHKSGRLRDAVSAYERLLTLMPDRITAISNLGHALYYLGDIDGAIGMFRKAIQLDPKSPDAQANLSLPLLLRGEFDEGWNQYEWRFAARKDARGYAQRQWDGADLSGRTILLYGEQGFGDTIQFLRYVPLVVQKGGRVIVECQRELTRLLASVPGIDRLIGCGDPLPPFDVHCPLASLPVVLRTDLTTIPPPTAGIAADPELSAKWKHRLSGDGPGLAVGISWAGNPMHLNDHQRSMAAGTLAPLAAVKGVRFYSLQKSDAGRTSAPAELKLIDYTADLSDFVETAAFLDNLDLVISVDTAIVHLAATIGRPVWTLLSLTPDWRWLLDRTDTPWYPTMRLFRQTRFSEWTDVISRVADALAERAAEPRESWRGDLVTLEE